MYKLKMLIITVLASVFCSWKVAVIKPTNANSWHLSIGKIAHWGSSKNNNMGDTLSLEKSKLKLTDTLIAERFICGSVGENFITTLTIKNNKDEMISTLSNYQNNFMFEASVPLEGILKLKQVKGRQLFNIYFTIKHKKQGQEETVLLARLLLKQ